jgi:hypothetical protein
LKPIVPKPEPAKTTTNQIKTNKNQTSEDFSNIKDTSNTKKESVKNPVKESKEDQEPKNTLPKKEKITKKVIISN